jgi:hypothetical protein
MTRDASEEAASSHALDAGIPDAEAGLPAPTPFDAAAAKRAAEASNKVGFDVYSKLPEAP